MSREIKFRAWDSVNKIMIPFIELIPPTEIGQAYTDKSRPDAVKSLPNGFCISSIMQYTGLKDKAGKEIYEGDIVQAIYEWETYDGDAYCEHSAIQKGEVIFSGGEWRVKNQVQGIYSWDQKTLEVIGTKFEHPHLLETVK